MTQPTRGYDSREYACPKDFECPVRLDFIGESPVIGVDADKDKWNECSKHPVSLDGMCRWVAESTWENRDKVVECPGGCQNKITVFIIDCRTRENPEFQLALEEWRMHQEYQRVEKPSAACLEKAVESDAAIKSSFIVVDSINSDRVARVKLSQLSNENEKLNNQKNPEKRSVEELAKRLKERFKEKNQLDMRIAREIRDEVRGEIRGDCSSKKSISQSVASAIIAAPRNDDDGECCLAKRVGIFNITLLTAFSLALAVYAYMRSVINGGIYHHMMAAKKSGASYRLQPRGIYGVPLA